MLFLLALPEVLSEDSREKLDLGRAGAALIPPRSRRDLKTVERETERDARFHLYPPGVRHLPLYLVPKIPFLPLPPSSPFFSLLSPLAPLYVSSSSFIFSSLIIYIDVKML